MAVLIAAYGVQSANPATTYELCILAGLCVCLCADIFLEIRFRAGGVLFFFGHVVYVCAFCFVALPTAHSLVIFFVFLALLSAVYRHYRYGIPQNLQRPLILYMLALCALMATSLPLTWLAFSWQRLLGAAGAALFTLSDILLLRNRVQKRSKMAHYVSLGTYFTGQLLLAASTLIF